MPGARCRLPRSDCFSVEASAAAWSSTEHATWTPLASPVPRPAIQKLGRPSRPKAYPAVAFDDELVAEGSEYALGEGLHAPDIGDIDDHMVEQVVLL